MLSLYTYFDIENIETITIDSTVQPCRKNSYLIIIYIFVVLLFFHLIVDFYCDYYCICI